MAEKAPGELIAITKAYDLVRETTRRVNGLPRAYKFVLGDRLLANAYDVLECLVEAKYARQKTALLDRANVTLEKMRFQYRLAHDEKLINTRQYESAVRLVDEVGRLVGGWRKSREQ